MEYMQRIGAHMWYK